MLTSTCRCSKPCHDAESCRAATHLNELTCRLRKAGCFDRSPGHYAIRMALIASSLGAGYAFLLLTPDWPLRLAALAALAFASVQAAFVAHEIGDGALGTNRKLSRWMNQILMTFHTGTSSTYFSYLHHLHHIIVTRGFSRQPSGEYVVNPYEILWLKRLVAWHAGLFLAVTTGLRALTFRLESLRFVAANPRASRVDRVMLLAHYAVWIMVPAIAVGWDVALTNYALIALLAGPYIGLVLVINHEGMSRAESLAALPEIDRVIRTTRNLPRSWLLDVIFGGVNNHIEHHLFPGIAAPQLPKARRVAEAFLRDKGYDYTVAQPVKAIREALTHFRAIPPEQRIAEALS